jgi:hypothetical protein
MFVIYPNAAGNGNAPVLSFSSSEKIFEFATTDPDIDIYVLGVTLSPRLCSGNVEPVFSSSLNVDTLPGTGLSDNNNIMTVNARCSNCHQWKTGSLDLNSTAQPWIYALGPNSVNSANLKSNSMTAGIERHSIYGSYYFFLLLLFSNGFFNTLTRW